LRECFGLGYSIRKASKAVGCSKDTALRYYHSKPNAPKKGVTDMLDEAVETVYPVGDTSYGGVYHKVGSACLNVARHRYDGKHIHKITRDQADSLDMDPCMRCFPEKKDEIRLKAKVKSHNWTISFYPKGPSKPVGEHTLSELIEINLSRIAALQIEIAAMKDIMKKFDSDR